MNLFITTGVVSAALGCAVVGGIFFAFSNFVMKALARLPAAEGIGAMQSINIVVLNKWFLGVFTGTALASLLLAGYSITNWSTPSAPWLLGGSVAYVVGSWLLTIAGNVPLNEAFSRSLNAAAVRLGQEVGIDNVITVARQLGIERSAAQEYIERYFARYPGVRAYMDRIRATAGHDDDPMEALKWVGDQAPQGLYLFKDIGEFLGDRKLLRRLRDTAMKIRSSAFSA